MSINYIHTPSVIASVPWPFYSSRFAVEGSTIQCPTKTGSWSVEIGQEKNAFFEATVRSERETVRVRRVLRLPGFRSSEAV